MKRSELLLSRDHPLFPATHMLSSYENLRFSKNGSELYFGIQEIPAFPDSNLLPEEIVQVEIWNYKDPKLYTQQKIQSKSTKEKSYSCTYDLSNGVIVQWETKERPSALINSDLRQEKIISYSDLPYQQYISWLGHSFLRHIPYRSLNWHN